MNELQIFSNNEFGQIRTAEVSGEPMFCLVDVCRVLEIRNVADVKKRLSKDGVASIEVIDSMNRKQNATFIKESNLYKVIFQSRKPEAEKFSDWVTDEVLPTLRKTGSYEMPKQEKPKKKNLSAANMLIKNVTDIFTKAGVNPLFIATEAKRLYKEQADVEIKIPLVTDKEDMPKLYDCTEIAKELGILSTNGKLHNQAVSAILSKLDIEESEIVKTAFSRNGHDDVTTQYKPSVYTKVENWLEENNYPSKIPYTDSKGNYKTYSVVYREVA